MDSMDSISIYSKQSSINSFRNCRFFQKMFQYSSKDFCKKFFFQIFLLGFFQEFFQFPPCNQPGFLLKVRKPQTTYPGRHPFYFVFFTISQCRLLILNYHSESVSLPDVTLKILCKYFFKLLLL